MPETVIKTALVAHNGEQKPCRVNILPAELLITSRGISDIHISLVRLSSLMFKDESVPDKAMAGFGLNYTDADGSAMLMFFEDGWFPVSKCRKAIDEIQRAHRACPKIGVPPLQIVDISALERQAAHAVIHRTN